MDRWVGKVAVVTGASSGIGAAILTTLADKGMIAVGFARRDNLIKDLAKKSKGTIHAVRCDMSSEEDILKAFKWVEGNLGGVDLLVNNAGIFHYTSLSEGTTEMWKETFDTNVMGIVVATKEAIKSMKKRGDTGHIIMMNSLAGIPQGNMSICGIYAASKYAVTSIARSLINEMKNAKSNIKITSISPGAVFTDMARDIIPKMLGTSIGSADDPVPEGYLSSQDMADTIVAIISLKEHVQIEEMVVQSTKSTL